MNGYQYKLYRGMLRLFATYGIGGATWRRTRSTGGSPSADPTITQTSGLTLRFMENNRIKEAVALPALPLYTAEWWGLADISVNVRKDDTFDNGTITFVITGTPDTSQGGFQVIPARKL